MNCGIILSRFLKSLAILLAVTLIPAGSVFAQSPNVHSAIVRGSVTDTSNHPLAGADAILQSAAGQSFSVVTDSSGKYFFSLVPEDDYTLRTQKPGYETYLSPRFHLKPGEIKLLDTRLEIQTSQVKTSTQPQFYDEPTFTVAGVTDASNYGGHGSDEVSHNRDALAKATVSLHNPDNNQVTQARDSALEAGLRRAAETTNSFDSNWELGKFLAGHGRNREALPYIEQASQSLERQPPNERADVHHLLADVEESLGDPLAAVKQYQSAAEIDPTEPNQFDWGAELLLHRALPPALEVFTKGTERFPDSVRMRIGLGATWYALGSSDKAEQVLLAASDLAPADPNPYLFLGKIQADERTISQQSVDKFARFVAIQPQNAMANYYYAVALWKSRQDASKVESLLQNAVQLDPHLAPAYLQLGILHAEQKDFASAVTFYKKGIEADPKLEDAHYRLALAYTRLGEKDKARQEFRRYEGIKKERNEQTEQERHELRQFVYTLKTPPASTQHE